MAGEPGRALGVDPGEVRIGLAVSDALGLTARPLEPLKSAGAHRDVEAIAALARDEGVTTVVVGLPLHMSGDEGRGAAAARRLVARLRGRLPHITVLLWDERLTTVEAERVLDAGRVSRQRRREVVDGLAAVLILQSYLDSRPVESDETR